MKTSNQRVRDGDVAPGAVKVVGSDTEFGNMIYGLDRPRGTGAEAAQLLIEEVDGFPKARLAREDGVASTVGGSEGFHRGAWRSWGSGYDPRDRARQYLSSTGGCCYIDLNHLEMCTPEVTRAVDWVAASHASYRFVRDIRHRADGRLRDGQRLGVFANNSDGLGNSYGGHMNFLLSRAGWERLFGRLYPDLFCLAAFQASSIVFTGQGKVGAEHGAPTVPYQLSQRADFIETVLGLQTTYNRPIVNCRDEAHCGGHHSSHYERSVGRRLARLHCICFDTTLCQVAALLKAGVMQLLLAALEDDGLDPRLMLDDPVQAMRRWSHDPTLRTTARLVDGKRVTAVELQLMFLERLHPFAASAACQARVPDASTIADLWADTLHKLESRNLDALAARLDWVLKRSLVERVLDRRSDLEWGAPEAKHLDHLYSSMDDTDGLYYACERAGVVETVVPDATIERFVHEPPEDTRAWTRAMVLRAGGDLVEFVDWDTVCIGSRWGATGSFGMRRLDLPDPVGLTRTQAAHVFAKGASVTDILDGLGAERVGAAPRGWHTGPVRRTEDHQGGDHGAA